MNHELLSLRSKVRYRAVDEEDMLVHLENGDVIVVSDAGLQVVQLLPSPSIREKMSISQAFDASVEQAAAEQFADQPFKQYGASLYSIAVEEHANKGCGQCHQGCE